MHMALATVAHDSGSTAAALRQLEVAQERVSELVGLVVRHSDEMVKDFETELTDVRPLVQRTLLLAFTRVLGPILLSDNVDIVADIWLSRHYRVLLNPNVDIVNERQ